MKAAAAIFIFVFLSAASGHCRSFEDNLKADVLFLSDSLRGGRGFGSSGNLDAAFHICKSFKTAGLWTRLQPFVQEGVVGRNVIGITPGFYDSYIVVGAHFDGLGSVDGRCFPGADSNASGIAVLLQLARDLARCRMDTGIIFVAFDGYGADLCGSASFLAESIDKYRISLMVNIDIIGSTSAPLSSDRPDYLIALGAQMYSLALNRLNRVTKLQLSFDYYGSKRFTELFYHDVSDQKWFLDKGIPGVMFTSGITMDTNRQTDTADRLDYSVMARRTLLIENWLAEITGKR